MIICACRDERVRGQMYRNCDLYVTYYERTGEGGNDYIWSELKNLGDGINTNDGWEGQPSMSADGNTLYFAANRPTTQTMIFSIQNVCLTELGDQLNLFMKLTHAEKTKVLSSIKTVKPFISYQVYLTIEKV